MERPTNEANQSFVFHSLKMDNVIIKRELYGVLEL